jgi:hypothetical protein
MINAMLLETPVTLDKCLGLFSKVFAAATSPIKSVSRCLWQLPLNFCLHVHQLPRLSSRKGFCVAVVANSSAAVEHKKWIPMKKL